MNIVGSAGNSKLTVLSSTCNSIMAVVARVWDCFGEILPRNFDISEHLQPHSLPGRFEDHTSSCPARGLPKIGIEFARF